ncbi:MAG TPA: lipid II flippase MurJ, partial [Fibrobacteraceae bacterium]|nr:lipid II flippase MurJ [Fibrobacteraceae bacterium]
AQAVLVRSFYAQERMWTPTLVNTGLFLLSIPLYVPMANQLGIRSVPIVGAVTSLVQITMLIWIWRRSYGLSGVRPQIIDLLRSLIILAIGSVFLGLVETQWGAWIRQLSPWTNFLCAITIGLILFALILGLEVLVGVNAAREVTGERLRRFFRR